ncbi:MAG: type II secretion system protein [Fibrobacter sp.]|nr:type II secretion system protein [Fibrobacter sp.]
MKKQGFTLIELMVVIVIMGILAAVAVPKLFGMIAKSKASEVGPAAGTYIKLQDAYVSESNKVGSWHLIGYVSPGSTTASSAGATTNFAYLAGSPAVNATEGSDISTYANDTKVWGAANKVALNECAAQASAALDAANWSISIKKNDNGNSVTYKAATNCPQLTPTFDKIGK